MDNFSTLSYLDRLRLIHGNEQLKKDFYQRAQSSKENAVALINDMRLQFYTLYILLPQIQVLNLLEEMNTRNIFAIESYSKILRDIKLSAKINKVGLKENKEKSYQALKWMINTGAYYDGISDDFDAVIDGTASLLIQKYQDKSILPQVAELIFSRNRKGLLIHDLSWAYFQSQDPYTLKIVAKYLISQDQADVKLARNLLNTNVIKSMNLASSNYAQYLSYISWLKENYSFLYFTGESFQLSSKPTPYKIDLGSKYLRKSILPHNKKTVAPLSEIENKRLERFDQLDCETQHWLAHLSHRLNNKSPNLWKNWMKKSIDQQVEAYQTGLGGGIK